MGIRVQSVLDEALRNAARQQLSGGRLPRQARTSLVPPPPPRIKYVKRRWWHRFFRRYDITWQPEPPLPRHLEGRAEQLRREAEEARRNRPHWRDTLRSGDEPF